MVGISSIGLYYEEAKKKRVILYRNGRIVKSSSSQEKFVVFSVSTPSLVAVRLLRRCYRESCVTFFFGPFSCSLVQTDLSFGCAAQFKTQPAGNTLAKGPGSIPVPGRQAGRLRALRAM